MKRTSHSGSPVAGAQLESRREGQQPGVQKHMDMRERENAIHHSLEEWAGGETMIKNKDYQRRNIKIETFGE